MIALLSFSFNLLKLARKIWFKFYQSVIAILMIFYGSKFKKLARKTKVGLLEIGELRTQSNFSAYYTYYTYYMSALYGYWAKT